MQYIDHIIRNPSLVTDWFRMNLTYVLIGMAVTGLLIGLLVGFIGRRLQRKRDEFGKARWATRGDLRKRGYLHADD